MSASFDPPQQTAARVFAWTAWGIMLVLVVVAFWLRYNDLENMLGPTQFYLLNLLFWMVALPMVPPAYATVAALILSRSPGHKVGWMCLFLALVVLLEDITWQYAQRALVYSPGALPFGPAASWLNQLFTAFTVPPGFLALMLYFFPNNRLPSRGWRIGVVLAVAGMLAMVASIFLTPEIPTTAPDVFIPNPTAVPGLSGLSEPLFTLGTMLGVAALLGGAASIVARWRKSNGVEQAQIKWLATVNVLIIVVIVALVSLPGTPESNLVSGLLLLAAASLISIALPAAIGVAVLRYKLWNIDRIIRRTLAYTLVTGLLALVYFGSVVLLQQFFRTLTGESSRLSVVISTLAIAALFNPVRQRVQVFIDLRFYRSRYDVVRMLSGFSETARDLVELEALADRLNEAVQGSMRPSRVGVWFKELKQSDEYHSGRRQFSPPVQGVKQ